MKTQHNPQHAADWESGKTVVNKAPAAGHTPFMLHEREHDGSLYIEQGSPESGRHQAFDLHCDRPTAELIVRAVNGHEELRKALIDVLKYVDFATSKVSPGFYAIGVERAREILVKYP
jgi:hypothetical protein